jgi:glycosyltransferase involved in cell wall biosynthesis
MKNILMITSRLPYPPFGGDKLKNFNLLKILSKYYNVHLVTVTNEKLDSGTIDILNQYSKSYRVFQKSKIVFFLSGTKALFNKEPLQVNYYYFHDVQKYIDEISKDVDCIISTLIRTSKYAINIAKPKIFDMADSIGLNYKKSSSNVKSLFWKGIYMFESQRLLKYEVETINNYTNTFLFNRQEIDYFNMPDKIKFIPHGVNEDLFRYENIDYKYQNFVAFFGKMDYQPNIDASIWFIENVLGKLNKNIKFIIVGGNPTRKILNYKDKYKNVEITGFVDDPYKILKSCLCIVAPMQTGAGIQNKVLETMALGTINIVSTLAAIPIGAEDKKDFIVLDNPIEIAETINKISAKKEIFEFYKLNSREFIKQHFTWSIYEKVYIDTIEEMLYDNTK